MKKLTRLEDFLNEKDAWESTKDGMLHIDLVQKYAENGWDEEFKQKFDEYKHKIRGFKEANEEWGLKAGDTIEFIAGYNDDIWYTAEVQGFVEDTDEAFIVWDSWWFPIRLNDPKRKVNVTSNR